MILLSEPPKKITLAYCLGTELLSVAAADKEQCRILVGILEMKPVGRREHGLKIKRCVDEAVKGGQYFGDLSIGVWRGGGDGLLQDSINIPMRLLKWLFYGCFSRNEDGIKHVCRELRTYIEGSHGYFNKPLVLKDIPQLILP